MTNIIELKRLNNETDEEVIYRICSAKEEVGTWEEIATVINKILNQDYGESTYRKKYQAFQRMLDANQAKFVSDDAYVKEIQIQKRALEKERKMFQAEKLEYNKWLREEARDELIVEKIVDAVHDLPPFITPKEIEIPTTNKAGILVFGDEHYGVDLEIKGLMGEILNAYSPEIFEDRMWRLFVKIKKIIEKENLSSISIYAMGDFADGVLRVSQLWQLRYGVVESSTLYGNFMANWLYELSKIVKIRYQMVYGNHTELRMLSQPKGTFTNENMGMVVKNIIKARLQDNINFEFIGNPTGMIYEDIFGYKFLGIHGEVRNMETALKEFSHIYNVHIDYLIAGHLHHFKSEEVGFESEVINVPSVIGIDDYSLSLRKISNAGAVFMIIEEGLGNSCTYKIKLN